MADGVPTQDGASTESMAAFVARRRREAANAAAGARAVAHQAFGSAIRNGQDISLGQPADVANFGAPILNGLPLGQGGNPILPDPFGGGAGLPTGLEIGPGAEPDADTQGQQSTSMAAPGKSRSSTHPGFAESLIPVWGSGKEAYADFQDGDYVGAGINGALAASDLFLAGDVAKAIAKGGWYVVKGPLLEAASKQNWKAVRRRLGKDGVLAKYQEGHHWFVPQGGWGKKVPEVIKNHPLNIKAMPDVPTHRRITGRYQGLPRFNWFDRYRYGTPTWSKVLTVDSAGHPAAAAMADQKK
jgi:hypothetical protein